MLKDHQAATMIPARDVARTGRWYEEVLGLEPVSRDPGAIAFRSGDSQLNVYDPEGNILSLWQLKE
jgi:predicted enzyme related to lactoylglutathione lyase